MRSHAPVSVIIPHFEGDILSTCIAALYAHTGAGQVDVIVVDDGVADDGSVRRASARFPRVRMVRTTGGLGYGAACNAGLRLATGRFVLFLNNDTEVTAGWLEPLLEAADRHPSAGFFQPKLISSTEPGLFPWGGGCGGEMDWLGYPFMRGNLVFCRERDRGQYDAPAEVFWANGAAMFARRAAVERAGRFDEEFYMQMEDVDLCWRARRLGIGVRTVPSSVVRHHGGWTLPLRTLERYFLSHRNSVVLLMKNAGPARALFLVPLRIVIEALGALGALLVFGNWRLTLGSMAGLAWVLAHPANVLRRRARARSGGWVPDRVVFSRLYAGSILFSYLFRGVRTASALRPPVSAPQRPPRVPRPVPTRERAPVESR